MEGLLIMPFLSTILIILAGVMIKHIKNNTPNNTNNTRNVDIDNTMQIQEMIAEINEKLEKALTENDMNNIKSDLYYIKTKTEAITGFMSMILSRIEEDELMSRIQRIKK